MIEYFQYFASTDLDTNSIFPAKLISTPTNGILRNHGFQTYFKYKETREESREIFDRNLKKTKNSRKSVEKPDLTKFFKALE